MSMLQVKDIKFVIYGVSFEQSDVNTLITEYETFEKKEVVSSVGMAVYRNTALIRWIF
jgi:hypothetical protein